MRWAEAILALCAASASAQDQPLSKAQTSELAAASAAAARQDCAGVLQHAVPLTQATPPLAEELRSRLYDAATWCAFSTGQPALGYRLALRGTALIDASDLQWRLRLGTELDGQHDDDALTTVLLMTQGRGAALNSVPVRWFSSLHRRLVAAHRGDTDARLLTVLTQSYSPDELLADLSFFRLDRARQLVATDPVTAKALLADLDLPPAMEEAVLDPALRALLPAEPDVRLAAERLLARFGAIAEAHPDSLATVNEVAAALMLLGRPAEALTSLEAARPRLAAKNGFRDGDTQTNWWWDNEERARAALGQYDGALTSLRAGAALKENGGVNVSQTINLAYLQYRFGHPADALATLAPFAAPAGTMSPVGEMEMRGARACSLVALGRAAEAAADVAFARANAVQDPGTAEDILSCAGDADGAAALLIARLDDPARRGAALLRLSDFDPSPGGEPDPFLGRLEKLKARADVRAAVARAGGTRRFHLQRPPG